MFKLDDPIPAPNLVFLASLPIGGAVLMKARAKLHRLVYSGSSAGCEPCVRPRKKWKRKKQSSSANNFTHLGRRDMWTDLDEL
jgi:hypothetical protein